MQPQLCSRCKKNIAVVFITRQENGQNVNEGLCLKCAKNLGLPQVDEMMRRMGITDEDLDNISNEMMGAFGGAENLEGLTDADDPDADNEDEDGKTATFPFLSRFFGGNLQLFFRHDGKPCRRGNIEITCGEKNLVALLRVSLQKPIGQRETFLLAQRNQPPERFGINRVDDAALFGQEYLCRI